MLPSSTGFLLLRLVMMAESGTLVKLSEKALCWSAKEALEGRLRSSCRCSVL
jgi:hypothetical protein